MFPLVLLAQMAAAATPAATPSPAPTVAVGTASGSVPAAPRTLADLARERKLGKKGVAGGTLSVAGTTEPPASVTPGEPKPPGPTVSPTEARLRAAEAEVREARQALDDVALRKGITSEDATAKRRRLARAEKELADAWTAVTRSVQ